MFSHAKMVYTEDGGVTWTESTDAPLAARQVFYSKDGGTAYVGTPCGLFWASHDDGKTWEQLPAH